jgi:hypothetical protein
VEEIGLEEMLEAMRTSSEPLVNYMAHRVDQIRESVNLSMQIPGELRYTNKTIPNKKINSSDKLIQKLNKEKNKSEL